MTTSTPPATGPARATGETSLAVLMLVVVGIVFFDRFGISYAFPYLGPDLGLSNTGLALANSATAIAWAVSSVVCSLLADRLRLRRKPSILVGLVLFSVATGLVGVAGSLGQLVAFRALVGLAEGPILPLAQAAVAAASSPHRRGRNLGIVNAGTLLIGAALTPVVIGLLAPSIGWRPTFLLSGAAGLLVAGVVALVMRDAPSSADERTVRWSEFLRLVRTRNVRLALLGSITTIGFVLTLQSFSPLFLAREGGVGTGTTTLLLALFGVAAGLGNALVPAVSDRVGRKPAYLVATAVGVAVPAIYVLGAGNVAVLALTVVGGLVVGGALPMVVYVISGDSVPPALAATTFAVMIAVGETVGGAGGPVLAGWLGDRYGLAAALWACSGLSALGLVIGLFVTETRSRGVAVANVPAGAPAAGVQPV